MEKVKIEIVALEEEKIVLLKDINIDKLNTELREGNKERQSLSDRIKEVEVKVKQLMKEVKHWNEELKKHQKIDYDIKAGQVAYCFEQSVCSYVLPQTFKNDDEANTKALLFLLNGKTLEEQLKIIYETELRKAKYVGIVFEKR